MEQRTRHAVPESLPFLTEVVSLHLGRRHCTCLKQLPWEMSGSAVFKLPPHKSPIAISSCTLGLLHQPASGFCSRWKEGGSELVLVRPSLSNEPWLLHCTAKCLVCQTFRRAPACNSHTSSSLGGQDTCHLLLVLLVSSITENGQCTADKGQETRKEGMRLGHPRVRMCH